MIPTFDDFVKMCQEAGKKIHPIVMHHSDFYAFVATQKSRQCKKNVLPKLSKICQVEFRKNETSMRFKHCFEETSTEVEFLKHTFKKQEQPARRDKFFIIRVFFRARE